MSVHPSAILFRTKTTDNNVLLYISCMYLIAIGGWSLLSLLSIWADVINRRTWRDDGTGKVVNILNVLALKKHCDAKAQENKKEYLKCFPATNLTALVGRIWLLQTRIDYKKDKKGEQEQALQVGYLNRDCDIWLKPSTIK